VYSKQMCTPKKLDTAHDGEEERNVDSRHQKRGSFFHLAKSHIKPLLGDRHAPGLAIKYLLESRAIFLYRSSRSIWVHGESPEQFHAAEALIRAIRTVAPQNRFLFTSTCPATVEWVAARFPGDLALPAPRNTHSVVSRFFTSLTPQMIVLLESDEGFHPKAMMQAANAEVPIVAINVQEQDGAPTTCALGARFPGAQMAHVCVRDQQTAAVLRAAGLPENRITVTGNLDFECIRPTHQPNQEYLRSELGIPMDAAVIIAENVESKEEATLIDAFTRLRSSHPNLVMLLEPQHRRQIHRMIGLLRAKALTVERRTQASARQASAVLILDVPGELPVLYSVAACVLAGGTFSEPGSALNPVAAAIRGIPVIFGPYLSSRADLARLFIDHRAAVQVPHTQFVEKIDELICSPGLASTLVANAVRLVRNNLGATEKTYRAIESLIPRTPHDRPVNQGWRVKARIDRFGQSAAGEALISVWMKRRIDSWEALRTRLGNPRTILCLGNGPSSEHPQLEHVEHDALFRVNWRWKRRGLLVHPDLVFVGDPRTFKELSSCIFAFEREWESFMLLRRLIMFRLRPIEYITVDLTPSFIGQQEWYARPTNGALMIVTAAALQPERLIISGVDLYLHSDGRYPGDLRSCNQYSQVHSRRVELQVIQRALQDYRGEVVILSDLLRELLSELNDPSGPR